MAKVGALVGVLMGHEVALAASVRGGGVRSGTRECRSCQALHSRNNLLRFTLKANAAFVFNPLIKELSLVVVVEFFASLNIALC
jgi:hypothetical protein